MIKNKLIWTWLYNPPLILIAITGIHIGWIYGLATDNSSIINLTALSGISVWLENGVSTGTLLGILCAATISAIAGLLLEPYLNRISVLILLFLQYVLVFVAMTSDSYVIVSGHAKTLTNGVYHTQPVPSDISVPLLFGLIWISFWHTYGIVQRYVISYNIRKENMPI